MNLIITCARHLEPETSEEITKILEDFGDEDVSVSITEMSGILTAKTTLEPIQVVRRIREMVLDEPWSIRYSLRIIPIQECVETKIEDIERIATKRSEQILDVETYRILVEKRSSDLSSKELISKIAKKIKNKVSLDFPDKIILIEILGNITGISILKQSDILSLEKTKRSISE